ncbi:MAG: TonB-dependent receptor [Nitrospirae bacterium]|nr:MAG: TonB-dependent receptor [Nitrospirota bacterium]
MVSPPAGKTIISKKPYLEFTINGEYIPETLVVLLDGVDITGAVDLKTNGFSYRPILVIPAGEHTITVTIQGSDGLQVQRDFSFSTRHTAEMEEAYSNNDLTFLYESVIEKPDDVTYVPHSRFLANLGSNSKLKEGNWEIRFSTNVRFLDQNIPALKPEKKGLNLANYLLKIKYDKKSLLVSADIGDIQLSETTNTIQNLARRGGRLYIEYNGIEVNTFVVNSQQVFGFREGTGIEGTSDDHIMGVSVEKRSIDGRFKIKGIYITGGEKEGSLGIYSTGGEKKGDVAGLLVSTNLFEGKLTSEAEIDFSNFDPDTADEFDYERDTAYRFKLGGYGGNINYTALYEYIGADYEVIGNQGLQKNRQGFSINGGISLEQYHYIYATYSLYHDNVDNNDLYPTVYSSQAMIGYSFNGIPNMPINLGYQHLILDSTDEPDTDYIVQTDTDVFSANLTYMKNRWNLTFQASHSIQNDKSGNGNDSSTTTVTFTPSYFSDNFSIIPNVSFNRSRFPSSNQRTDTYIINLEMRGKTYHDRVSYELAGTYNRIKASDGSSEQDTLKTNFRISYLLAKNLWGYLNPSVGIRGLYNKSNDRVYNGENEDLVLLLVFTAEMPFSF